MEEISILILVWAVWIAACLATRKASHLRIALVDDYLSEQDNLLIRIIVNCAGTVYFIAVFFSNHWEKRDRVTRRIKNTMTTSV